MSDLRAVVQRRQGFLFLPIVYRLAHRLEQMEWDEVAADASAAAYALRSAQALFHLPALVTHWRLGLEAEAAGADLGRDADGAWDWPAAPASAALDDGALARPPLDHALEVTHRLSEELRGQASTVAVLSGPRTLSGLCQAPPAALGQFYAALARAYAERGAQMLLVAEDPRAPAAALDAAALAPLFNVASYFRLPIVLLDGHSAAPAGGFDLTLGGAGGPLLPVAALAAAPKDAAHWRQESAPLLLTDGEVPTALPAEQLAAWLAALGNS